MGSAFFVWQALLLHTVLQERVCAAYTVPTEQTVANAALTNVGAHIHALTAALLQAEYDEPLQQLNCTCHLCIIHIYIALGD